METGLLEVPKGDKNENIAIGEILSLIQFSKISKYNLIQLSAYVSMQLSELLNTLPTCKNCISTRTNTCAKTFSLFQYIFLSSFY